MSNQPANGHKKLNFSDCMGMAVGQIIGSGIMVLTGIVIGLTGHGTPYAFIMGALLAIAICIPFIILTSTSPPPAPAIPILTGKNGARKEKARTA